MKSKTTPKAFQVLRELTPGPLSSLTNPDSASRVLLPRHTSCFHLLTHNILLPVACFWLTLFPFSELFFICLVYTCYLFNKCLSTYCMVRNGSMLEILAKLYQKKNESRFNTLEAESFCRTLGKDSPRTMIFRLNEHTIHLMILQRCRFCFIQSSTEPENLKFLTCHKAVSMQSVQGL